MPAAFVTVDGDDHPIGHASRVAYPLEIALEVAAVQLRVDLELLAQLEAVSHEAELGIGVLRNGSGPSKPPQRVLLSL